MAGEATKPLAIGEPLPELKTKGMAEFRHICNLCEWYKGRIQVSIPGIGERMGGPQGYLCSKHSMAKTIQVKNTMGRKH